MNKQITYAVVYRNITTYVTVDEGTHLIKVAEDVLSDLQPDARIENGNLIVTSRSQGVVVVMKVEL